MPRHLSVESVIDKSRISSDTAWVVLLDILLTDPNTREVVETLRIARNNENILFGVDENGDPKVYTAGNFTINIDQQQNQAPTASISAQDQNGMIESRIEAYAGGVFSEIIMTVVNADRLDKPPEIEETFQVTGASCANYVAKFQLGAENPLGIQFPKSRQWKDRCTWRFKGFGCPYKGPLTTCDYTKDGPNGCRAHFPTGLLPIRALPGLVRMNL